MYILGTSSSCVDPIFTLRPNCIIESGFHESFNSNYHHQIVYVKFNLQIIETVIWQMFFKIDVLKNFANFTRKHLC